MKKIFVLTLFLLLTSTIRSQTFHSISIDEKGGTETTVLTNEIDSITYDDSERQLVWTKDSLYKTALLNISSIFFDKFELPGVLVKTENIGDWSEMRVAVDGSIQMLKMLDGKNTPKELLSILPNENGSPLYSYAVFDDNGMPKSININECVIFVDAYYGNYIDLTIAYNDTIAYSVDSVFVNTPYSRTKTILRSWGENNWQKNFAGALEIASGVGSIIGGALLITGSVVSEAGTFGGATPISIPGIAAGTITIAGGVNSIQSGSNKLYLQGENRSNIGETIYYQAAAELISKGSKYIPDEYSKYLKDPNYSSILGKIGWINFFVGLSAGLIDNLYGKTVTWEDTRLYYQGKVITGLSKDIATNSATIRGYIAPDITKSLLNGSKIENEYGVVLYSTTDETERYIQKETNGDGGVLEYTFYDLKPATTYHYRVYYIDKTNGISLLGETKSFMTEGIKLLIEVQSPSYYANRIIKNISYASHCNEPFWEIDFKNTVTGNPNEIGGGILPNWGSSSSIPLNISCIRVWMPNGFINHPTDTDSFRLYYREDGCEIKEPANFSWGQVWAEPYPITTQLENLTPSKKHTIWIEITNKSGITIKDSVDFYSCHKISTEDYVDMGTGVLWSTRNVGADKYYQLGKSGEFLEGHGNGRLPSEEDYKKLFLSCDVYWGMFNEINGYFVVASNGNSIFLPVAEATNHSYRNYYNVKYKEWIFQEGGDTYINDINSIQMNFDCIRCSSGGNRYTRLVQ